MKVSKLAARRFLVRRSGLFGPGWRRRFGVGAREPDGPAGGGPPDSGGTGGDTLAMVRALEYVQVDPMAVLASSQHLVLGARISGYRPDVLDDLLYKTRSLVEVIGADRFIVPREDYPLFRLNFRIVEQRERPGLEELEPVMRDVMARLKTEGPLSSLDIKDDRRVSGWWDADGEAGTKAVRQALEWLWHFGRVVISHRVGSRRYFDLPERVFGEEARPPRWERVAPEELAALETAYRDGAARKYFRAMGLSDPTRRHFGWVKRKAPERLRAAEEYVEAGVLVPVAVEGSSKTYYVPAEEVDELARAADWEPPAEVRFLPPLDNLIWDRDRLADLFDFDYTWEAYVPAPKRKYGPYTCPILRGDVFAGRIDARMDRAKKALVVNGLWWEGREGLGQRAASGGPPLLAEDFLPALEEWAALCGASAVTDRDGVLNL